MFSLYKISVYNQDSRRPAFSFYIGTGGRREAIRQFFKIIAKSLYDLDINIRIELNETGSLPSWFYNIHTLYKFEKEHRKPNCNVCLSHNSQTEAVFSLDGQAFCKKHFSQWVN